jgi:O-methyltransferase involved in polyketide biosynthesis
MEQKTSIKIGTVQETLLLPLCGRAMETKKDNPRLIDEKAVEITEKLDYDFTTIIENMNPMSQIAWVARSLHTDHMILDFLEEHPEATIVNIGCGMETSFNRVDNGRLLFYELDLPEVIEMRKSFIEDSDRHVSIASSFLDFSWFDKITVKDGLLCVAGGVFMYFTEEEMKAFFIAMADHFGKSSFFFDALSRFGLKMGSRQVLKKGGMDNFQGGWAMRPVKSPEKWDPRISVVDTFPMYRGVKKGQPFSTRMPLTFIDALRVGIMVQLRIE